MKSRLIKDKRHFVFESEAEFEAYFDSEGFGIPEIVQNWRDGQEGDWVLGDDGGVIQILVRRPLQHNKFKPDCTKWQRGYIKTIVGTFIIRDNLEMDTDFDNHPSRHTFSTKIDDKALFDVKTRKVEKLSGSHRRFIAFVLNGNTPAEAWARANCKKYSPAYAKIFGDFLMRQPLIMNELREQVNNAAEKLGLDHKWVLDNLKQLAENSEEDSTRRLSVKDIGSAIGTFDKPDQAPRLPSGRNGKFIGFGKNDGVDAEFGDIKRPELNSRAKELVNAIDIPPLSHSMLSNRIREFNQVTGFNPETDKF